ncbi:PREDICTED: uncharacterized protein LOC104817854 [Tarenaya hassleriana]|uniref:uncharacterized protein LOC104817854 n=1 Tax=Tarenaya hassleriana TaxID=28532 RepID=UPI00053C6A01|nr:PREDICTED: uncharacterized protein LOC104817854 [Tarenaya hassleriana]
MKVTGKLHSTAVPATAFLASEALVQTTGSDLKAIHRATTVTRRKARNPSLTRQRRSGALGGRRSRPETPLLKWKVEDKAKERSNGVEDDDFEDAGCNDQETERETARRRGRRKSGKLVSVRKIAAGLWRLQVPESISGGGERRSRDRLGFQGGTGYMGVPFLYHHSNKLHGHQSSNAIRQSPSSVAATKNGFLRKPEPSIPFPHSAMEGATKWDPVCLDTMDEVHQIYSNMKRIDRQVNAFSLVSSLEVELEEAHARIDELENEKRSQKKKLEQFLRKVSEERAAWRHREHEKVRAIIDDMKADMNREKKTRQRLEIVNLKLVNELADTKLAVKRYMQDYEKERKARELIEEVCDELAKEIGDDKAEIEELKRESMKLREEVEEERKMLQMAEVWREERVQMKLIDAKVALEEKYTQMNKLVENLEAFLRSRCGTTDVKDVREAELLREVAASVNIQEVKEFTYEPPNSDDIFSVFEDMNLGEAHDREIEQCGAYSPASHASKVHTVSPDINMTNKERHSNAFTDQNGEIEEDESGWETVSHLEEQGSSYSPDGSIPSVNKNHRDCNISMSGSEYEGKGYEDTPVTEISEVCSVPRRQSKKVSSIAKLWRSGGNNGESYKIISMDGLNPRFSNTRKSNVGVVISPERSSSKGGGGFSPMDLVGQWSSPDSAMNRGMKGCIEWPRGAQKNSLKAKLIEARIESQKVQLKHVLKQKI